MISYWNSYILIKVFTSFPGNCLINTTYSIWTQKELWILQKIVQVLVYVSLSFDSHMWQQQQQKLTAK